MKNKQDILKEYYEKHGNPFSIIMSANGCWQDEKLKKQSRYELAWEKYVKNNEK